MQDEKQHQSRERSNLMTPDQAREYFGLKSLRSFYQQKWIKELPVYKVGNQNRYKLDDLRKFRETRLLKRSATTTTKKK